MEIKPMEIVKIGTVFALYGEQGELIIANRDKAVVEAALRDHKPRLVESEQDLDEEYHSAEAQVVPEPEKEEPLPDLADISYRELKAIAKEQGVPRYQRMKRDELQSAIEQLMTDTGAEAEAEPEPEASTEF